MHFFYQKGRIGQLRRALLGLEKEGCRARPREAHDQSFHLRTRMQYRYGAASRSLAQAPTELTQTNARKLS